MFNLRATPWPLAQPSPTGWEPETPENPGPTARPFAQADGRILGKRLDLRPDGRPNRVTSQLMRRVTMLLAIAVSRLVVDVDSLSAGWHPQLRAVTASRFAIPVA